MTEEANLVAARVTLLKQHFEVENRHDVEEMLATMKEEDPIREEMAGKTYRGRVEVAQRYIDLWEAFPDFRVEPLAFMANDASIAVEAIFSGTHKGVFNGYEPTGKAFRLNIVVIFQFDGGKIASESIYLDYASHLRQLGLAP